MNRKPKILFVGSDKGGTGKTTVTRVLLDYLDERKIAYRCFDCEAPNGDLKRFAPDAEIVDITHVPDQMKVLDGADPETVTVVDLRAATLSPTLQALSDARLLNDQMELVLLHVLGPTMSSIAEIAETAKRVGGGKARHFLIKNHVANQTEFFKWNSEEAQAQWQRMHGVTIDVPQLAEIACETMQKVGGSFTRFARDGVGQSRLLRGLVLTWCETVWAEFDRVGLGEIVDATLSERGQAA